jgi:iron complex transport system ATP-binding protein
MKPLVKIKDFGCGYPKGFRVSDINIEVETGGFVGIIGPNGCGKTTLFRGLVGDLFENSGSFSLANQDFLKLDFRSRAKLVAVVAQHNQMPIVTVFDYVMMGRLPHRQPYQFFDSEFDNEIVDHYLKLTNLSGIKNKLVSQLSGGERQMAAITRALVQEPKLLLLDEPTAHLDIKHQVEILNLVRKLNANLGLTVMMIIHDLNLASEYCNDLSMMKNGKIMYQGSPAEVLSFDKIEDVYETVVVTKINPVSNRPAIFLVSERVLLSEKRKDKNEEL